jgi:hypothetical protein
MAIEQELPQVRYGADENYGQEELPSLIDDVDDDEELDETPEDVVLLLGFDPLKEFGE